MTARFGGRKVERKNQKKNCEDGEFVNSHRERKKAERERERPMRERVREKKRQRISFKNNNRLKIFKGKLSLARRSSCEPQNSTWRGRADRAAFV
jgi:hypothetical protein